MCWCNEKRDIRNGYSEKNSKEDDQDDPQLQNIAYHLYQEEE